MSELIQNHDNRATIRRKLLAGASALALTAYISSAVTAKAEDADRPQIWIELGGQLSQLEDGSETFSPPLMDVRPSIFSPSQKFEKPPLYSIDEFADLSFQPKDSNWIFAASIQYGRSASNRHVHQQTYPAPFHKYTPSGLPDRYVYGYAAKFADTLSRNSEQHLVLDFQAGKDVGLGMFGKDGSSVVSVGVRIAQFRSKSNIALKSNPDWHFNYKYVNYPSSGITNWEITTGQPYHSNAARFTARRSFRGIGPSLSWKASAPFAGNPQDGELAVDWGVNMALLFGRQKTKTHHQTTGRYHIGTKYAAAGYPPITYQGPAHPDHTRSRRVTVPNVGGFAGLSFSYSDAKISLGYRADFFFNAIDGGIDARKNENRAFYGPYASISIGLGD